MSSLKSGEFWLAVNVFIIHLLEKHLPESGSNNIVTLCIIVIAVVNFPIPIEFEWLLKNFIVIIIGVIGLSHC